MTLLHALAGAWAECRDEPSPAAAARRAARVAGIVVSHFVGQAALLPYAVRALALRRRLAAAPPGSVRLLPGVPYGGGGGRRTADVYRPATAASPPPVAVLVHGGTWSAGDAWQLAPAAAELAGRGVAVVAINYGLWPAACIADAVADVAAATAWAASPAGEAAHGGDGARVALVGHSAGGHLAAAAALAAPAPAPPLVTLAGVFDLSEHYEFERARGVHRLSTMARAALGRGGAPPPASAAPAVAKALAAASVVVTPAGARRLPRALVVGGGRDSVVPAAQSTAFAAALTDAGAGDVVSITADDADHADFVSGWGARAGGAGVPAGWGDAVVQFLLK